MVPQRFASFLSACLASAAFAQAVEPTAEPPVERGHLALTAGVGLRQHALSDASGDSFTVAGPPSPTALRLDGAWYFTRAVGLRVEVATDLFVATPDATSEALGASRTLLPAFDGRAAAALRWAPRRWFSLEGQLGYALGTQAFPGGVGDRAAVAALLHGPALGLQLGTSVDRFTALAFLHATVPGFFTAPDSNRLGLLGTLGFTLALDVYRAPQLQVAVALDYRARVLQPYSQGAARYAATTQQLGLGLRVVFPGPEPLASIAAPRGGLRVLGVVRFEDGRPAFGAKVTLAGQVLTTGEDGRFETAAPSGPVEAQASLAGFRTVKQSVTVLAQAPTEVTLVLVANSGPGAITVTVRSAEKVAVAGAEVALEGVPAGRTDAQGVLRLRKAGPGPVKVTVKAKGLAPGDELVQVPPEGEAEVAFALAKQGERALATLRGLVRSATGRPIKASVKISGVEAKVQVKPDGRFVVQVPGVSFSLTISAPGHVTQVKSVDVADGDQALFHADLQPVGR